MKKAIALIAVLGASYMAYTQMHQATPETTAATTEATAPAAAASANQAREEGMTLPAAANTQAAPQVADSAPVTGGEDPADINKGADVQNQNPADTTEGAMPQTNTNTGNGDANDNDDNDDEDDSDDDQDSDSQS